MYPYLYSSRCSAITSSPLSPKVKAWSSTSPPVSSDTVPVLKFPSATRPLSS